MVGKLNSPGILVREVDATAFAPTIDSSLVGIVGFADKGPLNKATLITTAEQLVRVFGEPREELPGQGLLGALEILEATNRIYYVRVAGEGAVEASATIPLGACPSVKVTDSTSISYPFFLRVEVLFDGDPLAASSIITVEDTEGSLAANIVKYVGDGTADKDLFSASIDPLDPSNPYIQGSFAGSSFQLMVEANTQSNFDPDTGLEILQAIDKTGDTVDEPFSFVEARGVNINSSQLHYLVRSQHPGEGYNLGISLKTGEVTGISVETNNVAGQYFNIYVNDKGFQNESFRVGLVGDNTFLGTVIKSSEEETPLFSQFIKGEFAGTLNIDGEKPLISPAQKLNNLLTYTVASLSATAPNGSFSASANPRFVKLITGTYNLTGGKNGEGDDVSIFGPGEGGAEEGTDENLISVVIGSAAEKDGIYALDDDNLNISIALVPGFTNQAIQNELITLAESSQNFIAIVSPPYGLNSTQDAVNWVNGKGGLRTASINNSYVAVYWPWVQVFSVFDEKDRWIDPAIYAARQMVFTDAVSEPWFAPAGFTRGRLTKPLDTEIILSQGDRDALYDSNINPMVKFFPEGITIFGQKTAKRIASATDRINVRRLMIYLRKTLLASARSFVFEPNDSITWENIKGVCEDLLRDIASRRGIAEYRVICDDTTNTPLRVSRRELWCKIILRPVEAAEYIIFEVNLTNNTSKLGA